MTRLTRTGLNPITSEHGLALFDAALHQPAAQPAGQPHSTPRALARHARQHAR